MALAILQPKDAEEWAYRGEGAVNLILAYCGSSTHFVGKVLRIQKFPNNGTKCENGCSFPTKHEGLLWGKFEGIISAPTKEIAEQLYVQKVICPLLGSEHVDAGIRILVSREFLEAVEKKVLPQRPSWRVDAARVNPLCDSALLIADHSVFPHGTRCILTVVGHIGLVLVFYKDYITESSFYMYLSCFRDDFFLFPPFYGISISYHESC